MAHKLISILIIAFSVYGASAFDPFSILRGDLRSLFLFKKIFGNDVDKLFYFLHPVNYLQYLNETLGELAYNRSSLKHLIDLPDQRPDVSDACLDQLLVLVRDILNREKWALYFLDAWGKTPTGVTKLHYKSYGDFDLCRKQRGYPDYPNVTYVQGKYCMLNVAFKPLDIKGDPFLYLDMFGTCLPEVCTPLDLYLLVLPWYENFLNKWLKPYELMLNPDFACVDKKEMNTHAIITVSVALSLLGVVLLSTLVDYLLDSIFREEPPNCVKFRNKQIAAHILSVESFSADSLVHSDATQYLILNPETGSPMINENKMSNNSRIRKKIFFRILFCFSLRVNVPKLFKITKREGGNDSITCLNGIRVLTTMWIILQHSVLFSAWKALNAFEYYQYLVNQNWSVIILCGHVAPDTFFTISGLLVSYRLLTTLHRLQGKLGILRWIMFYVDRYIRLTPVFAVVVGVFGFTINYWSVGPSYVIPSSCERTWYKDLLFISNFNNEQCIPWAWYIIVDFQLYVLSPFFVYPLYRKPLLGAIFLFMTFSTVVGYTIWTTYKCHFRAFETIEVATELDFTCNAWSDYYANTVVRSSSYLVGIMVGFYLYKSNCRLRLNKICLAIGWLVALGTAYGVVFGIMGNLRLRDDSKPLSVEANAIYGALFRPAWAAVVAWLVVVCVTGRAAPLNRLLSLPILQPFARVTYSVYLTHVAFLIWFFAALSWPPYLNNNTMSILTVGFILAAFLIGFPASLVYEAPYLNLLKLLHGSKIE